MSGKPKGFPLMCQYCTWLYPARCREGKRFGAGAQQSMLMHISHMNISIIMVAA